MIHHNSPALTLEQAAQILAESPHHPTVTAHHLRRRTWRGWCRKKALQTPVRPERQKAWAHIGLAIDHYLTQQEEA